MKTKLPRAERDALVDDVAPLRVVSSLGGRSGVVVAVRAGAAAAVGDVQVDLAQTAERLAAQAAPGPSSRSSTPQVGRLVDVDPERQLRDAQAGACAVAQGVREQPGVLIGAVASSPFECVAPAAHVAGRRRSGSSRRRPPGRGRGRRAERSVERPRQVLGREAGLSLLDGDDGAGAGGEEVGEHGGETLAEGVAALREARPAAPAGRERVGRPRESARVAGARGDGRHAPAAPRSTSVAPATRSARVQRPVAAGRA